MITVNRNIELLRLESVSKEKGIVTERERKRETDRVRVGTLKPDFAIYINIHIKREVEKKSENA